MIGAGARSWEELSPELIEAFLEAQRKKGRGESSVEAYRRSLMRLYESLPEDKRITADTGRVWRERMEAEGASPRSINARLSMFNSLSGYLGHREFQTDAFLEGPEVVRPELSRGEYLRLLQAAKALDRERVYLLVKVLGGAGLRIQELPQLTVEAVSAGEVELQYHNGRCSRTARIPEGLRRELLDYIRREGLTRGPVFRTGEGRPLARTAVCKLLRGLSRTAEVDAEKVNPRCLWNMYQATQAAIMESVSALAEQAYARMLEAEDVSAAWGR